MGIDWEYYLNCEDSERLEDAFYADVSDYYCDYDDSDDYYCDDDEAEAAEEPLCKKSYAHGYFDGKRISFNREFGKHRFSDEEIRELLKGNIISITYSSGNGRHRCTRGRLGKKTSPEGRPYYGFIPEFDKAYSS